MTAWNSYMYPVTHMPGLSYQFQYLVWIIWGLSNLFSPNDCSFRQDALLQPVFWREFSHNTRWRRVSCLKHPCGQNGISPQYWSYIYLYTQVSIPICNDNLKVLNRTWLTEKSIQKVFSQARRNNRRTDWNSTIINKLWSMKVKHVFFFSE